MPRASSISAEQRQAILETLQTTHNAKQTAALHSVGRMTAWRIAKDESIALPRYRGGHKRGGRRLPAEKYQAVVTTLKTTHNEKQTARQHGVHRKTVSKIAKAANITLFHFTPDRSQISVSQRQTIMETLEATHSASAAARESGVGVKTVRKMAKAAGIALTKSRQQVPDEQPEVLSLDALPACRHPSYDPTDNIDAAIDALKLVSRLPKQLSEPYMGCDNHWNEKLR